MAGPAARPKGRGARFRLGWSALVLLVALSGAGLAVAADRQSSPAQREEVAGRLDHGATAIAAVYDAARRVSGELQALNVAGVGEALAEGDAAVAALEGSLPDLLPAMAAGGAHTERVESVAREWRALADRAQVVAQMLDALERHEDVAFDATAAGRAADWTAALDGLADASLALDDARAARNMLAASGDVSTLTDLIDRYGAFDQALVALYLDPGSEEALAAVERAQAALPASDEVLSLIVGEVAGEQLTRALVAIDEARAAVEEARSRR